MDIMAVAFSAHARLVVLEAFTREDGHGNYLYQFSFWEGQQGLEGAFIAASVCIQVVVSCLYYYGTGKTPD